MSDVYYRFDDAGRVLALDPDNTSRLAIESDTHGRHLVRVAVAKDGPVAEAIMHAAMDSQNEWSPAELDALNGELETCDLTINQWLERRST